MQSVLILLKDSLTLLALLGYLFWLNWKLTLFVGVLFPAVALLMRTVSRRRRRLAREGQDATDGLAYVVEGECVLRFDNEAGKGDHFHRSGVEEPYAFTSLEQLLADFWAAVDEWGT